MPKWVKTVMAFLLLPVCLGAAQALRKVVLATAQADTVWVLWICGAACWAAVYVLLPKPGWAYVLGHELTHVLWTWLFGGRVKKLHVRSTHGHVIGSKSNFLIALAPYFCPLYAILLIAVFTFAQLLWDWATLGPWFHLFIGAAYAFHATFTWKILQTRQPDLAQNGYLFSIVVIVLGNVLVLLLGLPLLAGNPSVLQAGVWWLESTKEIAQLIARLW